MILSTGSTARTAALRVRCAMNGRDITRVAMAVPGCASAVERNRARRRLRAAMRDSIAGNAGFDIVMNATPAVARMPFALLRHEISTVVARAAASAA
jgi:ribonuclease P protein component